MGKRAQATLICIFLVLLGGLLWRMSQQGAAPVVGSLPAEVVRVVSNPLSQAVALTPGSAPRINAGAGLTRESCGTGGASAVDESLRFTEAEARNVVGDVEARWKQTLLDSGDLKARAVGLRWLWCLGYGIGIEGVGVRVGVMRINSETPAGAGCAHTARVYAGRRKTA